MAPENDRSEALEAYRSFALGEAALDLRRPIDNDETIARWSQSRGETAPTGGSQTLDAPTLKTPDRLSLPLDDEAPATGSSPVERFGPLLQAMEQDRRAPAGAVLDRFLRNLNCVRLITQNAPFPGDRRGCTEWIDLALDAPDSPVQFIPLSVFTRRYFLEELPRVVAVDTQEPEFALDSFHYHRENDKALHLRERFPDLASTPVGFQYFIDAYGLTEIVIARESLGWSESVFAAALFCRYNGIPDALIDGLPVPTSGMP